MKRRIPIDPDFAALLLFRSDHTCCVCGLPGRPVQIHHLDEDPSNNDIQNLAVLCLECHDKTQVKGGFGRKLSPQEVRLAKVDWESRVIERKRIADQLIALKQAGHNALPIDDREIGEEWRAPSEIALKAYIRSMPSILEAAYKLARPGWASVVRTDMMGATTAVTDVVSEMWVQLSRWFPPKHFGRIAADQYISQFLSSRRDWHSALGEPEGYGSGGREAGLIAVGNTLIDAENAIVETVKAILPFDEEMDFEDWHGRWVAAHDDSESTD